MTTAAIWLLTMATAISQANPVKKEKPGSKTTLTQQQQLMIALNDEINHWNFSALNETAATALVTVKLTPQGTVEILRVKTDQPQFTGVIQNNLSKIKVNPCNCSESFVTVKLKYDIMP